MNGTDTLCMTLAALLFAGGGWFMKLSRGATVAWPTATFLLMFSAGAVLQARAMRSAEMGAVYLAVLGLEAAAALSIGTVLLDERMGWQKAAAVLLIVTGVVLLRRG